MIHFSTSDIVDTKSRENYKMTETTQMNNTSDKIAALTKEAENLKLKLEEERQKLNDVACKFLIAFLFWLCMKFQP